MKRLLCAAVVALVPVTAGAQFADKQKALDQLNERVIAEVKRSGPDSPESRALLELAVKQAEELSGRRAHWRGCGKPNDSMWRPC